MSVEEDAEYHYWRANSLYLEDNFKAALTHALTALELEPGHLDASIMAGEIYQFGYDELGIESEKAFETALGYLIKLYHLFLRVLKHLAARRRYYFI